MHVYIYKEMMANANDPRIFRIVSQMLKIVLTAGYIWT